MAASSVIVMDTSTEASTPIALPVRSTMILEFEGTHWKYQGAKESRVRELFSVGATAYYAELGRLLDDPAALAFAPMTVKRLRRLRDQRRRQRSARARGWAQP